jgi:hypothetical protein
MSRLAPLGLLAGMMFISACSWKDLDRPGPFGPPPKASDTHECDQAAAHPQDRQRLAPGVTDEAIVGMVAVAECERAVAQFPKEARFHFQLARAHRALRQHEQAHAALEAAKELGSAPARHYLGEESLERYWKDGDAADADRAHQLFVEAAPEFEPAADRVDKWELSLDGLEMPRIIGALNTQQFGELQDARLIVAEVVIGMQEYWALKLNPTGSYCPAVLIRRKIDYQLASAAGGDPANFAERALYTVGIFAVSKIGMVIDPVWGGDVDKYRNYLRELGARDAQFLAERYGCESMAMRQLYDGVVKFAAARRPLREYYHLVMERSFAPLFDSELAPAPTASNEPDAATTPPASPAPGNETEAERKEQN